jgi:hypothetical protein
MTTVFGNKMLDKNIDRIILVAESPTFILHIKIESIDLKVLFCKIYNFCRMNVFAVWN